MTSIVHMKRKNGIIVQDCDVYIGRSCYMSGWKLRQSIWYNPFTLKKHGTRDEILMLYETYVRKNEMLMSKIHELEGKSLGCWCSPESCHGDILIKILNESK